MAKRGPNGEKVWPKNSVVSFRAADDLVARLDRQIKRLSNSAPGGSWTRSSAALHLVLKGLDREELAEKRRRKK